MRQRPPDDSAEQDHTHQVFVYTIINLRSDRLELRPLIPEVEYKQLGAVFRSSPELWRYMNDLDYSDESVLGMLRKLALAKDYLLYAIYSSPVGTPPDNDIPPEKYALAATASFHNLVPDDLKADIGLIVFPEFQKSHVATHTVGLLLRHCLDLSISAAPDPNPDQSKGAPRGDEPPDRGLGLRRVGWIANAANTTSTNLALRMGMTHEGTLRNMQVMDVGKLGDGKGRAGDAKDPRISADKWYGSVTGLDWEAGVREVVERQMARTS